MTTQLGMHYLVSGKVQGVWFRANTKDQAEQLGVTGWVRNLPNGSVEVKAFGDENQLAILQAWLKRGPERAEVTDLTQEEIPFEMHSDFRVR